MRTAIVFEHSLPRRVLFPFFTIADVVLILTLLASGVAILMVIGISEGRAIAAIVAVGYLGAVITSNESSPASLVLPQETSGLVIELLSKSGYHKDGNHWSRRLIKSKGNDLVVTHQGGRLCVSGPYNALYQIREQVEKI
jgi:hypothetical protein